jgi:ABC-type thiamine transport system ATPase subunit
MIGREAVLLDEPFARLDPTVREMTALIIGEVCRRERCVVVAEHIEVEGLSYGKVVKL